MIQGGTLSSAGIAELFGSSFDSNSGEHVTDVTALGSTAFFCGVNLIANAFKVIPMFAYERTESGKVPATQLPAYKLVHDRPNPDMSPARWKWFQMACALIWGNAYSEIERDMSGRPIALWPIHPGRVSMTRVRGQVVHKVDNNDGTEVFIPSRDMLHFFGFTKDGIQGISVLSVCRESIGGSIATDKTAQRFFANNAVPHGVLEYPNKLSENAKEAIRRSWQKMHQGSDNTSKVALMDMGIKYSPIGMPPNDAQWLESRQFNVTEYARILNIPPHKLKDLSRATFSNITEQKQEFAEDAVLPWAVEMEQECTHKLISERRRASHFCEFNMNALMRGDPKTRGEFYQRMFGVGGFSPNMILAKENENSIGPMGDKHYVPANMMPIDEPQPEPEPAIAGGENGETIPSD